jgi:4'-phosphopantetheinyl transferase
MDFILRPDRIDLWLSYIADLRGEEDRAACRAVLSAAERAHESRFQFDSDRDLFIVARALTRSVLGRYCAVAPQDLIFESGPFGRPHLSWLTPECQRTSFSVSHTHGLAVVAVGCDRDVGLDVESNRRHWSPDVAQYAFAPQEMADLLTLPALNQHDRFFEYWTLKECYIKARSMGMHLPLSQFAFQFRSTNRLSFSIGPYLDEDPTRWQFVQFRADPNYIIALCIGAHSAGEPELSATRASARLQTIGMAPMSQVRRSGSVSARNRNS